MTIYRSNSNLIYLIKIKIRYHLNKKIKIKVEFKKSTRFILIQQGFKFF